MNFQTHIDVYLYSYYPLAKEKGKRTGEGEDERGEGKGGEGKEYDTPITHEIYVSLTLPP